MSAVATAHEAPGTRRVTRSVAPYGLLRLAGMPFSRLLDLRCRATVAGLRRGQAEEDALREQAAGLSDALFRLAPTLPDARARGRALAVRRAVFNLRPSAARDRRELRAHLPHALCADLLRFERRLRRHRGARARAPREFAAELRAVRAQLRVLLGREDFLAGVLLSSPDFYDALRRYLDGPAPDGAHPEHVEVSAMLYLGRMAAKATPFGTFTPTALGRLEGSPGPPSFDLERPREARTRLNTALVHLLARRLAQVPAVRDGLRVRLRASAWRADDRLITLRNEYRYQPIYGRHDTPVRLPLLARAQRVLETLRGRAPRFAELVLELCGGRPESRDAVVAGLERLRHHGLVDWSLELSPHDLDPLRGLIERLEGCDDPLVARTRAALRRCGARIHDYARADVRGRRRALADLQAELRALAADLGLAAEDLLALDPVREDVALPGFAWGAGVGVRDRFESELAPLFEALQLGHLQHSPAVRRAFVAQAGAGGRVDNLLAFFTRYGDELLARLARGEAPGEDAAPVLLEADRLYRRLNVEALSRARTPGEPQRVVELPRHLLPARLPALHGWPASVTVFFQVAARDAQALERGEYLLVLNSAQSGLGAYAARFCGLFAGDDGEDPLAELLRGHLRALAGGLEFVDMPLCSDSSDVQVHPRLTARDLAWPGEPAEPGALQLTDLDLCHDPQADVLRVVERASGRELLPLYLGGIHPQLFQNPAPTVINNITSTSYPYVREFWRGQAPVAPGECRHLPRVRVGRLVLARESWRVSAAAVPRPRKAETPFEFFERVHVWRSALGLPDLAFAKAAIRSLQSAVERRNKPLLVDFANPWTVWALPRLMIDEVDELTFTEMLPGPDELAVRGSAGGLVSEFQLELAWSEA